MNSQAGWSERRGTPPTNAAEGMVTDNLKAQRALYNGFGDTLARGIELVATPAIFGLIGFFLDRVIGITPVLTVVFVLFAITGMGVKMYMGYDQAMKAHEAELPKRHA